MTKKLNHIQLDILMRGADASAIGRGGLFTGFKNQTEHTVAKSLTEAGLLKRYPVQRIETITYTVGDGISWISGPEIKTSFAYRLTAQGIEALKAYLGHRETDGDGQIDKAMIEAAAACLKQGDAIEKDLSLGIAEAK